MIVTDDGVFVPEHRGHVCGVFRSGVLDTAGDGVHATRHGGTIEHAAANVPSAARTVEFTTCATGCMPWAFSGASTRFDHDHIPQVPPSVSTQR